MATSDGSERPKACSATNPQPCAVEAEQASAGTGLAEFENDPTAHARYDAMIEAMRAAETLSWESDYRWETEGPELGGHAAYRIWMKKPNFARLEASVGGELKGVLVLDGTQFWVHWPSGRPRYQFEDEAEWQKTRFTRFMQEPAPPGHHSIAHQTSSLGAGMLMTVIQPSRFHGGASSLDPYLDGVQSMGREQVGDERCDVIEVSFMKRQRSHYVWLSERDHLPRKLKEVVRVEHEIVVEELWSDVRVNEPLPDSMFAWAPPDGWEEWSLPDWEEGILKAGTAAPDFDLAGADGGRIRLSDCRGKVVWLTIWRVGCPPCREEMPEVEKLYQQYRAQGLVVIGLNASDDRKIAQGFLRELKVTFPNVLDASEAAWRAAFRDYQTLPGMSAVPLNYIIDREGRVVTGFYDYDREQGLAALKEAGIEQ